ncbi:uncharacterized protein [Gossypium hirsutum]|uniref:Gag-Pol polyprotein n=1 Tax=Gossypium hirsutum TaxID=3635 RepID=A0ABM2ZFN2_GOSHI|nr:uncharacterized protein LOC121212548 [Gossypium hirsutum]
MNKPLVDKIQKHRAEDFRANVDDNPERAEFWLKNSIRVFDELSCTPNECLKCAISLLRDSTYHWWNTLVSVKCKEFLELKKGRMSVTKYEREFLRLSKYAREFGSTDAIMCKRFEGGLNEDIRVLVRILELKEFLVLVEGAYKAKELNKEKRKVDCEAKDLRKRPMSKPFRSHSKKSKEMYSRSNVSVRYSHRDRGKQHSSFKSQAILMASVVM